MKILFSSDVNMLIWLVILGIPFFLFIRLLWALIKKLEK